MLTIWILCIADEPIRPKVGYINFNRIRTGMEQPVSSNRIGKLPERPLRSFH